MMDMQTAADVLGAKRSGPNVDFAGVTTDSRQVRPGDLFVALRGERFDGHAFTRAAFEAGAVAAMVDAGAAVVPAEAALISVPDTRTALGQLAAWWRRRFSLSLVAVTGSNGKTTVKEMLAAVLRAAAGDDAVLATTGNLNNDIGMPLMLLRLRERHRHAVIEMGMNHLGEIAYLTRLAAPTIALVTNAGAAHLGELGSRDAIAQAKGEIYQGLGERGIAVVNADDGYVEYWRDLNRERRVVDFGIDHPALITARCDLMAGGSRISVVTPASHYEVRLQVPGLHNVRNALAAAAAAYAAGIDAEQVSKGLARYAGTPGRLQRRAARDGATLIDDTYNANPDSVRAAIAVLAAEPGRRVLVLGDMGELGARAARLHCEVGTVAREAGVEQLLTLGELSREAAASFGPGAKHFQEVDALCAALAPLLVPGTTVLVKGSRFMRMERVVERFVRDGAQSAQGGH